MGLMVGLMNALFGGNRNVIAETAEVFRENAEAAGQRGADAHTQVLQQFAAEFARPHKGLFDQFIDGVNRLPRPMMALGTLALFAVAMVDPVWFASRMQGLAVVPEPLWWLMGAIVGFYFGARHQVKGQEFQQSIADTLARLPQVQANLETLGQYSGPADKTPKPTAEAPSAAWQFPTDNAALLDWQAQHGT